MTTLDSATVPDQAVRSKAAPRPAWLSGIGAFQSAAVLYMAVAFLLPVLLMTIRAVSDPQNFVDAFSSGIFRRSIWTTVRMSLTVTVVCLVVSYPYAYVLARARRTIVIILATCLLVSFWTSTLVRTYSWQLLLNNTGLINTAMVALGIVDEPIRMMGTDFAVYLGMAHVLAPYTVLTIYAQMRAIPRELEEAAQIMGSRPATVFWRVIVPLSRPGALAGAVLVFVMALGFYITPQILGSAQNVYIGTAIVQQVQAFLSTDVGAAQAVVLLLIVLITLAVGGKYLGIGRILGLDKAGQR
ncbi:ABC transporter permease [Pseudactinotalea suaedae]|uniref:ABC transporter permease n=1 Tax=Pseudactinotalea suaedae TaxID=1524924 RepID=UPI0012E2CC47|nr:ABC transporter permease [Pseudactinotalea suaedae]